MVRGDGGKVIFIAKDDHLSLATSLRARTAMGNEWVAKRLEMGHDRSVSRLIRHGGNHCEVRKCLRFLGQMLQCED